ncbi:hypothetical protein Tco_0382048 [Tanacetum coccineum]
MKKTILKQQYENFTASRSEGLDKTYNRFQKLISQLEIHDTIIMDDLYNNLKGVEAEIKRQSSSSSTLRIWPFGQASSSSYADDVMFSLFVSTKGFRLGIGNGDVPGRIGTGRGPTDLLYWSHFLKVHHSSSSSAYELFMRKSSAILIDDSLDPPPYTGTTCPQDWDLSFAGFDDSVLDIM